MGVSCSSCYCAYSLDNLKCKLRNAAQRRQAKRPCRCLTRRPRCLMIRRKNKDSKCNCTHQDCALGLAKPPTPVGCGPPMKSPCRSPSPTRLNVPQPSPRPKPPCLKPPNLIPPCLKFPALCQKKTPGKCSREVNTDSPGILTPCQRPASPTLCLCQAKTIPCPSRNLSPSPPRGKSVSRTMNTENLCPVRKSRSPTKAVKPVRPASRTRSPSPSPEEGPVYVCCGGEGSSPDRKNVCRFTVDAYFT